MIKYINSLDTGGQWETDYILARKINEIIKYINDKEKELLEVEDEKRNNDK